jgi:hypothetical protein
MPFSTASKNLMLDALTVDRVRLHSGDPGAAGTNNTIAAYGLTAATFAGAASGERALSSDVSFTGAAASQDVTHWSAWLNSGTVFRGSGTISAGDVAANAAGEYTLKATNTKLRITDS